MTQAILVKLLIDKFLAIARLRHGVNMCIVSGFYLSSQARKSSTRERLTVISKDDLGSGRMRSLPPACFIMLVMDFSEMMQLRDIRKNLPGSSSSLITSSDESMMYLCSSKVTR